MWSSGIEGIQKWMWSLPLSRLFCWDVPLRWSPFLSRVSWRFRKSLHRQGSNRQGGCDVFDMWQELLKSCWRLRTCLTNTCRFQREKVQLQPVQQSLQLLGWNHSTQDRKTQHEPTLQKVWNSGWLWLWPWTPERLYDSEPIQLASEVESK